MTTEVANLPFAMTAPDGFVSLFFPACGDVRVYQGERGTALYITAEDWAAICRQIPPPRTPPEPSAN